MKLIVFAFLLQLISFQAYANDDARNAYSKGDYAVAFQLFHKEAEEGKPESQFRLALMYREGQGTVKNLQKAIEWHKKAVQQNYRPSIHELGVTYLYGYGTNANQTKALEYFEKGHELNYALSTEALARIYIDGEGGAEIDFNKGMPYLMRSIEDGMPNSFYMLAHMYFRGIIVPENVDRGLLLLIEAANEGMEKAEKEIKRIKENLEIPLDQYLKEIVGTSVPLDEIKICPSPSIKRYNCTITWDD